MWNTQRIYFFIKKQSGSVCSRHWHDFIYWCSCMVVCSSLQSKFSNNMPKKYDMRAVYCVNGDNVKEVTLTMSILTSSAFYLTYAKNEKYYITIAFIYIMTTPIKTIFGRIFKRWNNNITPNYSFSSFLSLDRKTFFLFDYPKCDIRIAIVKDWF